MVCELGADRPAAAFLIKPDVLLFARDLFFLVGYEVYCYPCGVNECCMIIWLLLYWPFVYLGTEENCYEERPPLASLSEGLEHC